jgi:hypothetical protein
LPHDVGGLFLAKVFQLNNFVEKLATCAKLSDNIEKPLILIKLENLYDIRVILATKYKRNIRNYLQVRGEFYK